MVLSLAVVAGVVKAAMRHSSLYDRAIPDRIPAQALDAHRLASDDAAQVEVGQALAAGAIFDPKAFAKAQRSPGVPPSAEDDITVEYDGEPAAVESLTTAGLAAFGVPELVIHDVPAALDGDARSLLYATADAILAGKQVDANGHFAVTDLAIAGEAAPHATLSLASEGTRIAIVFPGSKATVTDRVAALLQSWAPAEVGGAQDFDESPEVMKLEVAAREEIRAIAAKWTSGTVPRAETMTVEAPFRTLDNHLLYLEVDVEKIDGVTITGVLASTPSQRLRDTLTVGSRIETPIDNVLDYQWLGADGAERGGAVDALLDKLEGPIPAPAP